MNPDKPGATDAELRRATATIMKDQPGSVGPRGLPRRVVHEREAHRATLEAWAMVFKGLALLWWAAGAIVIISYVVAAARTHRLLADAMKTVPSHLVAPAIVITITIIAVIAFAAGAFSWAVSLALVSLGHIEENTRLAAGTEHEHSLTSPPTPPRHPPPYLDHDA
jgi:hypothetical protein